MRSALEKAREAPSSTKARILVAAERVFAAKGFAGASTREIAAQARVNISSLHYHWSSKETLYFAVFQNIYDRILDLVRRAIPGPVHSTSVGAAVIDQAMGGLFDFFAEHPTVPKLLVRRLLENDDMHAAIEDDILVPAWKVFAAWAEEFSGRKRRGTDFQLFMLTVYSVLLLFLLDSRQFSSLLGSSVSAPKVRRRVRAHIIQVVKTLLAHS